MSRDRDSSSSSNSYSYEAEYGKYSRNSKSTSKSSKSETSKDRHRRSSSRQRSYKSRSRSRSRSKERRKSKSRSKKHKSKHSRSYRDKSRDLSPIAESDSRHKKNGSHSRYRRSRSKSRDRTGKSRKYRSYSSSSRESITSYKSRHGRRRSNSSSDSGDRVSRSGSIVKSDTRKKRGKTHLSEEITNKIAKAVEQAASSVFDKLTNAAKEDATDQPIRIESEVLDEINSNSFVPKAFVSQSSKESSSPKDMKQEPIEIPQNETCLLHHSLIIDDATKTKNWIRNLHLLRMRLQDS